MGGGAGFSNVGMSIIEERDSVGALQESQFNDHRGTSQERLSSRERPTRDLSTKKSPAMNTVGGGTSAERLRKGE